MVVWAQNDQISHQGDLKKGIFKDKENPLRYMTNVSKIPKKIFLMYFDTATAVCVITMRVKDIYLHDKFSWGFFICLTPFFRGTL